MELGELLTELRENILHDRSDRIEGSSDYLWTDETLVRYINEAQRRFARRGLLIRDGVTPEVTRVALQTGVTHYSLHPSVLAVTSAKLAGDRADLTRTNHRALNGYQMPDPPFFDADAYGYTTPGKPLAFSTDEYLSKDEDDSVAATTMRIYPAPSADYNGTNVELRVVRLPLNTLTTADMCGIPEIPEMHHLEMLDWAAYLALRIVDLDAGTPDRAADFKQTFEENAGLARKVVLRKMFRPLGYKFGTNGFTWVK